MNPRRHLPLLATALLTGCFDSSSSTSSTENVGFRPWAGAIFENKVVLRSAAGKAGPILLTPLGLSATASTGWHPVSSASYGTHMSGAMLYPFTYSLSPTPASPWLDSTLWIDAIPDEPTLTILTNAFQDLWVVHLEQCADLPQDVFGMARDSFVNPTMGGAILRSGSHAFAFVHAAWPRSPRAGVVIVRIRNSGTNPSTCGSYSSPTDPVSARWTELLPKYPWYTDGTGIRILSAIPVDGGVLVSFESQRTNDSTDYRLVRIDTSGTPTTLDSSKTDFHRTLLRHGGRVWSVKHSGVVEINRDGSTIQRKSAWDSDARAECFDVAGNCVLRGQDKLYAMDSTTLAIGRLDNTGLEGNFITGVVQYKDTVYVSTLSGVFTKPVARFFDPAQ